MRLERRVGVGLLKGHFTVVMTNGTMNPTELTIEAYFHRQMTAIGTTAMEQIGLMHVLVVGLSGCGVEIAKCLAMSGVQRLTLLDDELVRDNDLSLNFLLRPGDQGKPKAKLVASRLSQHTPFADVRTLSGSLSLDLLLNFHVVVFASASLPQEELLAYDEFCRAQAPPIGVVAVENRGLFGVLFTDFSMHFQSQATTPSVNDATFSILATRSLVQLGDDARGDMLTVVVRESGLRTCMTPGDHVLLLLLLPCDGSRASTLHQLAVVVLAIVSDRSMQLRPLVDDDSKKYSRSERQSRLSQPFTKLQRVKDYVATVSHRSLRESLLRPGVATFPLKQEPVGAGGAARRGNSLHMAMLGIHAFRREFGFLPTSDNSDHVDQTLLMIQELLERNAMAMETEQATTTPTNSPPPPLVQSTDVEETTMRRALRCVATELLPLSAVVAGHAALQVLKFTGALGSLLATPTSQFAYFDVLDLVDRAANQAHTVSKECGSPFAAIFGQSGAHALQTATPLLVGTGAVNMELLKNLLRCGVGGSSSISVVLDPSETTIIHTSDLYGRAIFPTTTGIGQSKLSLLKSDDPRITTVAPVAELQSLPWQIWHGASAVCVDAQSTKTRLIVDDKCRTFETPAVVSYVDSGDGNADDVVVSGVYRIDAVVPHHTATFSERLISGETIQTQQANVFAFDHIPTPATTTTATLPAATNWNHLRRDARAVQQARECFQLLFQHAFQTARSYFEHQLQSSSSSSCDVEQDQVDTNDQLLWMVWSVVQRGHGVDDFADCQRIAWILLELLPVWLQATTSSSTAQVDTPSSVELLEMDTQNPDHAQLLVATACIIAASLRITTPPVAARRSILTSVAAHASSFSLHCCPRTVSSIRQGFASSDAAHILTTVVSRVHTTSLDLNAVTNAHSHFIQALANVQLSWPAIQSPYQHERVMDLPHLRRLCGDEPREFAPVTTILGGVATLSLMRMLLRSVNASQSYYQYSASISAISSSVLVEIQRAPAALALSSMPLEITRGVPLRVVPEPLTRWSKIVVPTSVALQSAKSIVQFLQTKFAITIHAIHHDGRCVLKIKNSVPPQSSIFDLCDAAATSSPAHDLLPLFIVLEMVAADARGDVVLAPVRINRIPPLL